MFALHIDSTNVVIANPASPSGAGFAGVQDELRADPSVGALTADPSISISSRRDVLPPAARHGLRTVAAEAPSARGFANRHAYAAGCAYPHARSIDRWRTCTTSGGLDATNGCLSSHVRYRRSTHLF